MISDPESARTCTRVTRRYNRRSCDAMSRGEKERPRSTRCAPVYRGIPKENHDLGSPISSTFLPRPPPPSHLSRVTSQKRPFPSLYRRCSVDLALPRGSKRDNRVTMPTRVGKPSSLSPFPSSLSFCFAYVNHTRAYPRCVVWRGVVRRGAMWPRLDSIRVAAADRCVAMTTLPPPVIQLPPRTPLSRPLPLPRLSVAAPSRRCRHPPDGWVDGCPLIAPFVTSSTVIVSHHDPLRGSVSRGIATRSSTLHATSSDPNRRLPETHCPRSSSLIYSVSPPIRKTTNFHRYRDIYFLYVLIIRDDTFSSLLDRGLEKFR